jgi:hypothetical protein
MRGEVVSGDESGDAPIGAGKGSIISPETIMQVLDRAATIGVNHLNDGEIPRREREG